MSKNLSASRSTNKPHNVQDKDKVLSIVEARWAMRSPDETEVDEVDWLVSSIDEEVSAVLKGSTCCHWCGGHRHIAAKCATLEPTKRRERLHGKRQGREGQRSLEWSTSQQLRQKGTRPERVLDEVARRGDQ